MPLNLLSCRFCLAVSLLLLMGCVPTLPEEVAVAYQSLPEEIDFNLHIRNILSDRCYNCHGPDDKARKANLRLDLEQTAKGVINESSGRAIVEGNTRKSTLVRRILSDDPHYMMPDPQSNLQLSAREKALLVKWIEQGAQWKEHWAFLPPESVSPPAVQREDWIRNPIDNFVLQRLEMEGLTPSGPADKERLLRRVSLDLRGIPPTIKELDEFLTDHSENAYEKQVDRMLASSDYGERMALEWCDVARYADSHGLHADGWRSQWPWRDWVINAFNANKPYDQFIIEQMAGDLLPNATRDQILATAFHRNHPMTAEGGVVDEEFRLEYVFDRTNTTAKAFLGLTMECARCHDHKFDPITQKDFYALSAFFNNVKELGMTGDDGNYGPMLLLPDEKTEKQLEEIKERIDQKLEALHATGQQISSTVDYIRMVQARPLRVEEGLLAHFPLDRIDTGKDKTGRERRFLDRTTNGVASGDPKLVPGRMGPAINFDNEYDVLYLDGLGLKEWTDSYAAGVWINTRKRKKGKTQTIMGTAGGKNSFWRGWDFFLDDQNRPSVRLIHSLPHNYVQVTARDSVRLNQWTHLLFTYNGSGKAKGLKIFINGSSVDLEINYDRLYKSIHPVKGGSHVKIDIPIRVAKSYRGFTGEVGIFEGMMDDIKIFNNDISELQIANLVHGEAPDPVTRPIADLRQMDKQHLLEHYLKNSSGEYRRLRADLRSLRIRALQLFEDIDEIMVMEEMPKPRTTFVLNRGQYDAPTTSVEANTPGKVLNFPSHLPKNRLGLAQWLVSRDNPLTARVTVNRYWQLFFGTGLVRTADDFGSQGSLPTHPQLLDWLALYFVDSGWDIKALHRLIVTSATYQQSSLASPEQLEMDPFNERLARGPKHRLPAELIRDNALAASGLLVKRIGGASVKPYQPEGLWIDKGTFSYKLLRYRQSQGDSLYRKSMYTFIKRTSPHPAMVAFDAPSREVCTVKRENTNTPLQALVLMNDPQFVEAARVLAQRIQTERPGRLREQLILAFRLLTSRTPRAEEIDLFTQLYQDQLQILAKQPQKARALLSIGEFPFDSALDASKTAALTVVTNTMMNHDEAFIKR